MGAEKTFRLMSLTNQEQELPVSQRQSEAKITDRHWQQFMTSHEHKDNRA
jgi:hypothetical protein